MRIELLYFDGCPAYGKAERALRDALDRLGIREPVRMVAVNDGENAERLAFPGSPTIRVDGKDLFPVEDRKNWHAGCRIYTTPDGLKGYPTARMIRAALGNGGMV